MNGGSPPTAPKARAGLFTPPGITRQARAKASWLLGRRKSGRDVAGVVAFIGAGTRRWRVAKAVEDALACASGLYDPSIGRRRTIGKGFNLAGASAPRR